MSNAGMGSRRAACRSFLDPAKGRRSRLRKNPFESVLDCAFWNASAIAFAVVIVKILVVADEPGVMIAGENLYVAPAGSPLAVKNTLSRKVVPPPGVIAKW